jgi:hypothetical protein
MKGKNTIQFSLWATEKNYEEVAMQAVQTFGRFGLRCSLLFLLLSLPTLAKADDLRCGPGWSFDGNGFLGTLNVTVDGAGNVTGTVYGDPIHGFYNNVSNEMMFIRSSGGSTDPAFQQVFTGYYWQEGLLDVLAGSFEAFVASGATAGRHRFGFNASCPIIG